MTELLEAIKSGNGGALQDCLKRDPAAATGRTPEGVSLICIAMYHRQPEFARMLAANRDDLDIFEACTVGATDRVRTLLRSDPSVGQSFSPDGFAPIALAAYFGWPDIVELLAKAGVDVNAQARNAMQVAAIHAAVAARDVRSVEILLKHKADPNLAQQGGVTPMQVATANGQQQVIDLLTAYGAR